MKLKVNKKKGTDRAFFHLEKLKDVTVAKFRTDLARRFAPLLLLQEDSQQIYNKFTNMEEVSEENFGKARKINEPWITPEVIRSCDEQKEERRRKDLGEEEMEDHRRTNRETRKLLNEQKTSV